MYDEDFVISKSENDIITTKTEINGISLPAEKGTTVGKVYVYCNGEEIGEIPLVTAAKVTKISFFEKIKNFIISIFE